MLHRLHELAAELVESSLDVPGFRECAIRVGGRWWIIRIGEAELIVREPTEAGEASGGKLPPLGWRDTPFSHPHRATSPG
jgi:hypothetical protein